MEQQDRRIVPINIEDEMQEAYLEYAMSVIVGRALPDARDGLKPVHRRILYAMYEASNTSDKPYKKSARIVGDVIGKYHPHGDQAVYDSLVRMAQEFSLRYPIVDGQGNFGSIDGDAAAAMRYTEVRLEKIANDILADLDKDTVEFVPNYDGHQMEPDVLPTRLPNLLVNGSSGIAVGMSTNIPPHNMTEVIDGCLHLLENPTCKVEDLCGIIKGPDFPTGGTIVGIRGIHEAYARGHGVIRIKGKAEIENFGKKDQSRERIIVTELPFQVNKAKLIERIAELVKDKQVEGISDLRDESNREGMRVVIELKRDVASQVILNQLYKFTNLQVSFGIQMIAIDGKRPRLMSIKELLQCFLLHRRDVVTRRSLYELRQCEEKAHILEGLSKAISHIDEIIALIKAAASPPVAKEQLIAKFSFSEKQAQAILDLRLQRLTGLERDKIEAELKELKIRIQELKEILANETKLLAVIKKELQEVRDHFGDTRKTQIMAAEEEEFHFEDLTEDEEVIVTFSKEGYIKRMPTTEFHSQNRGGKGVIGVQTNEGDFVVQIYQANTHGSMLCLTNFGRVYKLRVHDIPEASRTARGKNIVNLIQLNANERVQNVILASSFGEDEYLVLLTKHGTIKKMEMSEFENVRVNGKNAITLAEEEGDALVGSRIARKGQDLLICTQEGMIIRFSEEDVRATGTTAMGVRGITLDEGDAVMGLEVCDDSSNLVTITEQGYGKQTPVVEYRKQSRGGKGIITCKVTPKTGKIIAVLQTKQSDEIMIMSSEGKMIRTAVEGISSMGRNTQGVRVMSVNEGERVAAVTILRSETSETPGTNGAGAPH